MTDLKLPPEMAELRTSLPGIVALGGDKAPWFSVLLSNNHNLNIIVNNREERVVEPPPFAGTVLSAFDGETMHERSVGGFSKSGAEKAARELVQGLSRGGVKPPEEEERRADYATPVRIDPMRMTVQEKLDRCRELHRRLKDLDPRIVNAQVLYREYNEHSVFANRSTDIAQRIQRVVIYLFVFMAEEGSGMRHNWHAKSGSAGWEVLEFSDRELSDLVAATVALLKAERIEPGEYQFISAPGVSGVICHESFGHGVETDMFLKERARAANYIDQVVASPLVNIYDDPSLPGIFGSYFFDNEGFLSKPTQIVENGVFRRGITDFYSAHALGIPRSANGRRQDYTRKAYARMSNTFVGAGSSSLEDMLAQVDHGIYLDKWSSGMEDPKGWGIQVTCHYGHEIRGGKITDRVFAPIGISGYVPDVLKSISAVSSTRVLEGGGCGKGHKEMIPVASGGPHLLMKARLG
jgi:TldD protein